MLKTLLTVEDLRALRARRQARLYDLAPIVGLHPSHLGAMLSGKRPMPAPVAERLAAALEQARESA